jgi:hypothetical protein
MHDSFINEAFDYFNHFTMMRFVLWNLYIVSSQFLLDTGDPDSLRGRFQSQTNNVAEKYMSIEWDDKIYQGIYFYFFKKID